jgi:hypothetical protein
MADIRCLICNRLNDASAQRCWYCNTLLPKSGSDLTDQEQSKRINPQRKSSQTTDIKPQTLSEEQTESSSIAPEQEEVPEWLERIRKLKQQDQQTDETQQRAWVKEEQPDWLRRLAEGSHPQGETTEADSVKSELKPHRLDSTDEIPEKRQAYLPQEDDLSAQTPSDEVPPFKDDFLAEILAEEASEAEHEPLSIPDWSFLTAEQETGAPDSDITRVEEEEVEKTVPLKESEPAIPFPIQIDDLPEWLADEKIAGDAQENIEKEAENKRLPEKKLEKANLPAWLASLRPIQSVIQRTSTPEAEPVKSDQGFLAGIRGTLPGKEMPQQVTLPNVFGSELRVSAPQRKNAELFHNLLNTEPAPFEESVDQKTIGGVNKVIRLLVTVVLLLAVIIPLFSSSFSGVVPVLYPAEVVSSFGLMRDLPADKPVLVAAHFEAGLAGEMNWTAQPVLKHLVSRGVPMALTSTNVIGFAILRDLVSQTAGEGSGYSVAEKVVDLGYLPGGAIGLGALVSAPLNALPFTTDILPVGEVDTLQGINTLADFGALILVTDNPEVARSWVEQIDRAEIKINTLAVISAQAAPLLQPYYNSGQIDGYVSGMVGALSYELLTAQPGSATIKFNAYQISLLIAAFIVLVGGIYSLIVGSTSNAGKESRR